MKSIMSWLPFERTPGKALAETRLRRPSEMDRLFERFMADPFGGGCARDLMECHWAGDFRPARFVPAVDVADEKSALQVTVELPGMSRDDVEVMLRDEVLVVRGEKRVEHKEEKGEFYRLERSHGRFERAVPLPAEVDGERAEARFQNGVLTVMLPKVEGLGTRSRIPIETA